MPGIPSAVFRRELVAALEERLAEVDAQDRT